MKLEVTVAANVVGWRMVRRWTTWLEETLKHRRDELDRRSRRPLRDLLLEPPPSTVPPSPLASHITVHISVGMGISAICIGWDSNGRALSYHRSIFVSKLVALRLLKLPCLADLYEALRRRRNHLKTSR